MTASSRDGTFSVESIRSLFRGRRKSHAKSRTTLRKAKLGLESLEDRVVLTTFMVNTFNDTNAVVLSGPSAGTDANGDISLRSALEAINYYSVNSDVSDTIELPAGTYNLDPSLGQLILSPSRDPNYSSSTSVTIVGEGGQAVIDAQDSSRVLELVNFSTNMTVSATLQNLTLENGAATDGGEIGFAQAVGGGILDDNVPLSLVGVNVNDNSASASSGYSTASGGGVYVTGAPLSLSGTSAIEHNVINTTSGAQLLGAGVAITNGNLTVTDSTIAGNGAVDGSFDAGGGIYADNSNVTITDSAVNDNVLVTTGAAAGGDDGASGEGGGIEFVPGATLTIDDSTIDHNQVDAQAGGAGSSGSPLPPGFQDFGGSGPVGAGNLGGPGGIAMGGGIDIPFSGGNTNTPVVTIENQSQVEYNTLVAGAGGAGGNGGIQQYQNASNLQETYAEPNEGGEAGYGGEAQGAGISVADGPASVTISGATISNNTATGGAGGNGGDAGPAVSTSFLANGFEGGDGGSGGPVLGAGAYLRVAQLSVSGSTFQNNKGVGGAGGAGGAGAAGAAVLAFAGGDGNGGMGGAGGMGGGVFGAALGIQSTGIATYSAVTVSQNQSQGGAGGTGGTGGAGANNSDQFLLLNSIVNNLPIPVLPELASFIETVTEKTTASAGADGGAGGTGGAVTGAAALYGTAEISGSAFVLNTSQGGIGGAGGQGGNGGNVGGAGQNGGSAGDGGPAGSGGFGNGAGLTLNAGTGSSTYYTVTNSTFDSNSSEFGEGGAFGSPGTPGAGQPLDAEQLLYPFLNAAISLVPAPAGTAAFIGFHVAKLALSGIEYATTQIPGQAFVSPQLGGNGSVGSDGAAGLSGGAGLFVNGGSVYLINDTVTRNQGGENGGVYVAPAATVDIGNTIVADNLATNIQPQYVRPTFPDVESMGTLNDLGHNFIGVVTSDLAGVFSASFDDQFGTLNAPLNPMLGPLQPNGDGTDSRMPTSLSPTVNAGSPLLTGVYFLSTDQAGNNRLSGGMVDIGADQLPVGLVGATLIVDSAGDVGAPDTVLTLAEAIALTNGLGSTDNLTAQQLAQINYGTGSGPDTIEFASSLGGQTISLSNPQATDLGPSALLINEPVVITAPSTGPVTITLASGVTNLRLFEVATTGQLTLSGIILDGGQAVGSPVAGTADTGDAYGGAGLGGAIFNAGTVTLDDVTLKDNQAYGNTGSFTGFSTVSGNDGGGGAGGEIFNLGTLTVTNSTFDGNVAGGGPNSTTEVGTGGALLNDDGTVTLTDDTFQANLAAKGESINNFGDGGNTAGGAQTATITQSGTSYLDYETANEYYDETINNGTTSDLGQQGLITQPSAVSVGATNTFTSTIDNPQSSNDGDNDIWELTGAGGQFVLARGRTSSFQRCTPIRCSYRAVWSPTIPGT